MQYGMIIDLERCVGCHACTIACKAEWEVPFDFNRNWLHRLGPALVGNELASTYYPGMCNHCTEPACVPQCQADQVEMTFVEATTGKVKKRMVAATWKDPCDGTVQIDKNRCLGCGACVDACPYRARYIMVTDGKADKCTYCRPRVAKGFSPACVQTCISGARIFGDIDDPQGEVAAYVQKGAVGLDVVGGTLGPNTRYFGKKRDLTLLMENCRPKGADLAQPSRRAVLAALAKAALKKVGANRLLGMIAAILHPSSPA